MLATVAGIGFEFHHGLFISGIFSLTSEAFIVSRDQRIGGLMCVRSQPYPKIGNDDL